MLYVKTPTFIFLAWLGFVFHAPLPAVAQRFAVGVKTGLATLEPVTAVGPIGRQLHPLVFGPVIEVGLPHDLSVELSALHRHITYRGKVPFINPTTVPPEQRQEETKANSWELPLVLKRHVPVGSHLRPLGEIGLAIRHTSSTTYAHGYLFEQQVITPGGPSYQLVPFFKQEQTTELVKPWGVRRIFPLLERSGEFPPVT